MKASSSKETYINILLKRKTNLGKWFRNFLPQRIVPKVVFTGGRLSSKFQVRGRAIFNHNLHIIYCGNCLENFYPDNYVGETSSRISEKLDETLGISEYWIIGSEYKKNWEKTKESWGTFN